MIYSLRYTSKFKTDLKRAQKSGNFDASDLQYVLDLLMNGKKLPREYLNHELHGKYSAYMECHLSGGWLLMYSYNHDELILTAIRLGTHADLF